MAPFLLSLGFESGGLPLQTRWSQGATGAGPLCVLVSRFLTCLPPLPPPQVFFIESVCDDPTVVASNIMVRPRWTPGQFLGPEGGRLSCRLLALSKVGPRWPEGQGSVSRRSVFSDLSWLYAQGLSVSQSVSQH